MSVVLACDIGAVPTSGSSGPDGGADPGTPVGGGGGGEGDAGTPVEIACDDAVATGESGEHNAGQPCLNCHGNGDAPSFSLGGTVYSGLAGGSPVVGATIRVIDAVGTEYIAISARNGNFWLRDDLALPVRVSASSCPSALPMVAPSPVGNCNAGGCHDADFRIHLP